MMLNLFPPLKVTLSFFVCNLLVVVTYTYRFLLHDRDSAGMTIEKDASSNDDDFTTRPTRPVETTSMRLTTVDLDIPTDCQTTKMTARTPTEALGDLPICS